VRRGPRRAPERGLGRSGKSTPRAEGPDRLPARRRRPSPRGVMSSEAGGAAPMTQAARHARISDVLTREDIRSQGELAERLGETGAQVTQATLSRDLDRLGTVMPCSAGWHP